MLQLTRSGTVLSGHPEDLERLRMDFDRQHCLLFRELLNRDVLKVLLARLPQATVNPLFHDGHASDLCLDDSVVLGLLYFLTNNKKLFDVIRQATGCGPIGCFQGRVYRMLPAKGHHHGWHNDMMEGRMIGMSINLSDRPYSGGIFQLRHRSSKEVLFQIANTGLGDAVIFRIASDLEHWVTNVEGSVEKTAFAGWFRSLPEFGSLLARQDRPGGP